MGKRSSSMKQRVKIVVENTAARRNPVAAQLSKSEFRRQTVESKRVYRRRGRNNKDWE
jgi:hypothetical protein